jgi:flagellar P-ring protein precursor FlgI
LARTVDAVSVEVLAPADTTQRVAFLSSLENLEVTPGEAPARVIVNSRTGTVVIGSHVRVMPAAVTHGSMVVTITEDLLVSQPPPFADGPGAQTVVVPDSSITVEQPESRMFLLGRGVTLNDIVQAVNAVGAAPADLVAILEALKQAGALQAELIVI